jgi:hypothetical protein
MKLPLSSRVRMTHRHLRFCRCAPLITTCKGGHASLHLEVVSYSTVAHGDSGEHIGCWKIGMEAYDAVLRRR